MSEVVLKDLPESWEWTKLGEVIIKIVGGGTPSKNTAKYWEGNIPWLTIKDMRTQRPADTIDHITQEAVDESSTNLIPADTVIMATRVGLGKVVRVPYATTINQDLKALITPPELDKSYLEYWLVLKAQYLGSIGSGTTVKGIRLEQVKGLDFPLAPAEQQKRIVAKIEELFSHIDAGIAALNKAKQLLKKYRQSVLKAAVTGELTKQWREDRLKDDVQGSTSAAGAGSAGAAKLEPASQLLERILQERRQKWEAKQLEQFKAKGKVPKDDGWKGKYKEPEAFAADFEVPEGWIVCPFEQLILELKNGISKKPSEDQGLAILRISAVRPMVVYKDDVRFLPENFDSKDFEIEDGDLLFTRYNGNPEFVGVCGKVKGLENKTVYPDKLMRARPVSTKKLCTDYLELSLNCGISKNFIRSVTKTTAGQSGVAGGDVKKCPTVLPPYDEQVEIANIVSGKIESMKRLDVEIDIHLLKAEKNKQSILASAFSGSLY